MKKIQKNCALYTKSTKKRNNVLTCIVRIDIINLTNKTAGHLGCYCKAGKTKFYGLANWAGPWNLVFFIALRQAEDLVSRILSYFGLTDEE